HRKKTQEPARCRRYGEASCWRLDCQPRMDSRTRVIVRFADSAAFWEPLSRISRTPLGLLSHSRRLSRMGAIQLITLSPMAALDSMQAVPAERQPLAAQVSVSGGEKSLCQS